MMKFFLIIFSVILLILTACTKQAQQEQAQEHTSLQKTQSYREKLTSNLEPNSKNSSNNKSTSAKTVKDKLNHLEIYTTNDLLTSEEINLLSDVDKMKYVKILSERVCDSKERISLYIYEYMRENNLFDLCNSQQQQSMLIIAANYIINQGKYFKKVYELYDSFIDENHDKAMNVLSHYFNYLNANQDYKKADEVFEKITNKYENDHYITNTLLYLKISAGKFLEPFQDYQKNMGNFISNIDKTSRSYKIALSDLAQRIAREELYPDFKYKPQNIKSDYWIEYIDGHAWSHGGYSRETDSRKDPAKRMFTEFDSVKQLYMRGLFDKNPKRIEIEKYIEAVSNAYNKLSLEYGEQL